jgi:hypothetical protein
LFEAKGPGISNKQSSVVAAVHRLADLARAYDLLDEGFDANWPKPRMLSFLKRYESEMLFHKPPKREFYFMRAGR